MPFNLIEIYLCFGNVCCPNFWVKEIIQKSNGNMERSNVNMFGKLNVHNLEEDMEEKEACHLVV